MEKLKNYWWLLTTIITVLGAVVGVFMAVHNLINKNNEILKTLQTTQQMALKSVIWNKEIPITERANACDVYLSQGYNSLTKKECEIIVNQGTEKGVFSYAREEEK